jgi:hypothetical protein
MLDVIRIFSFLLSLSLFFFIHSIYIMNLDDRIKMPTTLKTMSQNLRCVSCSLVDAFILFLNATLFFFSFSFDDIYFLQFSFYTPNDFFFQNIKQKKAKKIMI